VPYLKFSRDKRGYETFGLFEPPSGRQHQGRARLLFWFRTAPHIKVGREPFSEETRRAIEARNPDIVFDWARLMATPIPPPDVSQHWRERRRAERTARRSGAEGVYETAEIVDGAEDDSPAAAQIAAVDVSQSSAGAQPGDGLDTPGIGDEDRQSEEGDSVEAAAAAAEPATGASEGDKTASARRHRRRRRGRRPGLVQPSGSDGQNETETAVSSAPVETPPPIDEV
jgi:hypothetical protein